MHNVYGLVTKFLDINHATYGKSHAYSAGYLGSWLSQIADEHPELAAAIERQLRQHINSHLQSQEAK